MNEVPQIKKPSEKIDTSNHLTEGERILFQIVEVMDEEFERWKCTEAAITYIAGLCADLEIASKSENLSEMERFAIKEGIYSKLRTILYA